MKKIGLILILILGVNYSFAQGPGARGDNPRIKEARVKFLKERLNLNAENEQTFFTMYDEFHSKRRDIRIEITQNRMNLRKSNLSDKEAKKVIENELAYKREMVELEAEYVDKFQSILTVQQVIDLYKAEDDFNKVLMERVKKSQAARGNGKGSGRQMPRP